MEGKNGEKPKIQITESVKTGIHSTVFFVGESPNLKPNPTQNHKKLKKIQFEFFVNKSLKIHNAKNICRRAFCLAPNERELSNLLTLSISLEAPISWMSSPTFP